MNKFLKKLFLPLILGSSLLFSPIHVSSEELSKRDSKAYLEASIGPYIGVSSNMLRKHSFMWKFRAGVGVNLFEKFKLGAAYTFLTKDGIYQTNSEGLEAIAYYAPPSNKRFNFHVGAGITLTAILENTSGNNMRREISAGPLFIIGLDVPTNKEKINANEFYTDLSFRYLGANRELDVGGFSLDFGARFKLD